MVSLGRVMLVDDDEHMRRHRASTLTKLGFDVLEAGDGAEALRLLEKGAIPDLIILDILMPRMNGLEFRMHQLSNPKFSDIPTSALVLRDFKQSDPDKPVQGEEELLTEMKIDSWLCTPHKEDDFARFVLDILTRIG